MARKRFTTTFVEGAYFCLWLWKLERRRGQTFPGTLLFVAVIAILIGLLKKRNLLSLSTLPVIYWISYLFTLFQAIPKSFLDIAAESWRWLQILVSPAGAAWGLLLYLASWGAGLWGVWYGVSTALWGYSPPEITLITATTLSIVVGLCAFLAAIARLSYATANILALPLVLVPLLLTLFRNEVLLENLLYAAVVLTLALTILPLLWEG